MDKIKINKESIIYIFAPAFSKTGGPELLHQLYFNLKKKLNNVILVYYGDEIAKGIHPSFKKYTNSFILEDNVIDDKLNVVIVPEVCTNKLYKYKNIRKIVWWTSVDNYLIDKSSTYRLKNKGIISALKMLIKNIFHSKKCQASIKYIKSNVVLNFVQSMYAQKFLELNGINKIYHLSDYINDEYFKNTLNYTKKEDIVCYNPKKGYCFTKKIISRAPKNIKFIPIINMNDNKVIETFKLAKIYIDFGNHPGKDRMPREAAILGCCVITNYRGSAFFHDDVPISDKYKFVDKNCNLNNIINKIIFCLNEYELIRNDFSNYLNFISSEKKLFIEELNGWYYFD